MIQVTTELALYLFMALLGLIFGFGKVLLTQFEKRMEERMHAQDLLRSEQLSTIGREVTSAHAKADAVTAEFRALVASLPLEYLRREDWIRFSATIDRQFERVLEVLHSLRGHA
jgi:hypothetical protein